MYYKKRNRYRCSAIRYRRQEYLVIDKVTVMYVLNLNSMINYSIEKTILSDDDQLSLKIFYDIFI